MDLWSIGGGGISLSWKLYSVMVFQRSVLNWQGVHQPEVFSIMVFHGSMVNWRGMAGVSLSWRLFGVMVFQRSMLSWQGCPSARSIQCNGLPWIYCQLEEGGLGSCISCCCSCCSSAIVHPQLQINNNNNKNNNNNNNIEIHLHKLFNIFLIIHLLMMIIPM